MKTLLLTASLLLSGIVSQAAFASVYYVSTTGSDSNDGLTINTAFLTPNHAAGVTNPGDTVNLMCGTYAGGASTTPLSISRSGSSAGGYITYQSYQQGQAGCHAIIAGPATGKAIVLQAPVSYIIIQDLEVAGANGSLTLAGAWADVPTASSLYSSIGILAYAPSPTPATGSSTTLDHHLMFLNNVVHDFPSGGIITSMADYVTISGNTVYNCAWYAPYGSSGISIYSSRDIDAVTGYKNFVTNNVAYNNFNYIGNTAVIATVAATATAASGSTTLTFASTSSIPVNTAVYDSTTRASITPLTVVTSKTSTTVTLSKALQGTVTSGDSIIFASYTDGEGIIIDDNFGDQQSISAYGGRTLVENNLTYNNGSQGILAYNSGHVDILYNTLYQNQTTPSIKANNQGDLLANQTSDSNFFNNVVSVASGYSMIVNNQQGTTTFGYNLGYNGTGTLPGSNNLTSNPNFVAPTILSLTAPTFVPSTAAFELLPGSPAIDAATNTYTRATDILGNPGLVGPSYDMGAYESPCSNFAAGSTSMATIRTPAYLTASEFQDQQAAGSITPTDIRDMIVTLACGRAPYAH